MPGSSTYKLLIVLASAGLAIALTAAALLLGQRDVPQDMFPKPSVATSGAAPDFRLTLLDGGSFRMSEHNGNPVLVNFFASWCLPCREEMPAIEKIAGEYRSRGVVFVAVSTDDTDANARDFINQYGVTIPVGIDKGLEIQKAYGLYGIPVTYFVDRQGMVGYFHSGAVTEELMRHELDKLL